MTEYVAVSRDAVEWLKKNYPVLCEKAGLCERIGGRLYTKTTLASVEFLPRPAPSAVGDTEKGKS